jgi:uncharacterized protein YyaL (SSP411 family)
MKLRAAMLITLLCGAISAQAAPSPLQWNPWSNATFARARAEHKFVLLDLEAVWCHWCHVMDDITYRDPSVTKLLNQRYVLVKVDQDSRPDIANRYQDWGWPATIVFAADGSEIVKRQGYIPPRPMASMLQAIIDDPSPGPSVEREAAFTVASSSYLSPPLVAQVKSEYEQQYDIAQSGWGFGHKYLDRDSVECALRLAASGNRAYALRLDATLHNATALIDPVWGGMYQYSVDGKWTEPHYEKLISIQADALREYSLAYAQTGNPEYLRAAQAIHRYVANFLTSPATGAFYVSQDADLHDGQENAPYFRLSDAARRAQSIPRIDTHVYARENGWMIAALCDDYAATGDTSALHQAQRAVRWIMLNRSLPGGGYRHSQHDPAGPYLGDTLAMGQAFIALYKVTGNRGNLYAAAAAARFIAANFAPSSPGTGFVTSRTATDSAYRPHPDRDENIALVRFLSLLCLANGDSSFRAKAGEAMRYLASPQVALKPLSAGLLLANQDFTEAPIHVTILGSPNDPIFTALHTAALRSITSHELIETRDPSAPDPPASTIFYPHLSRAALFLCTAHACSSPIFQPDQVRARIERALQLGPALE